ncbi:MAG: uroporphyrinogen-III C-methyltransferase [Paracoccaceae bacterium]
MNSTPLPPHPSGAWPVLAPGAVWLVGGGPGAPGLLTLDALNALDQADVVVHDALVGPEILNWAPSGAELIPAGKRGGRPSAKQADITDTLIALARAGRRVVRLKGGDPYLFGRGGEESEALAAAGVPFRVLPGITAGIAGLAAAGIPATHRDVNQALTFVTGHDQTGAAPAVDWASLARGGQVIVIYMGMKHLEEISAALIAGGRDPDEPVAIIREATTPRQFVLETTLAAAAAAAAKSGVLAPAIICIGKVRRIETP